MSGISYPFKGCTQNTKISNCFVLEVGRRVAEAGWTKPTKHNQPLFQLLQTKCLNVFL